MALAAIKRTDSGICQANSGSSANGAMPPTSSRPRQPNAGMICPASRPPRASPAVKPLQLRVTSSMRRRAGEYSELRVMQVGIAPPRPMPVIKRNQVRDSIECA